MVVLVFNGGFFLSSEGGICMEMSFFLGCESKDPPAVLLSRWRNGESLGLVHTGEQSITSNVECTLSFRVYSGAVYMTKFLQSTVYAFFSCLFK